MKTTMTNILLLSILLILQEPKTTVSISSAFTSISPDGSASPSGYSSPVEMSSAHMKSDMTEERNTVIMSTNVFPTDVNTALTEEPDGQGPVANGTGGVMTAACRAYRFALSVGITGSVCLLGFVGNILALFVLTTYDRSGKKSSTPLLLGSLAASDILVLITVFMMKTVPSFCYFTHVCGNFLTEIFPYFEVYGWPSMDLAHAYSTWIIVVVTVHRYIAVCWPHKAKSMCTRMQALKHLIVVVILCTVFELPVFLDFHLHVEHDEDGVTTLTRTYTSLGNNHNYQVVYKTTLYYAVMYVIPLIILTIFTTLLIRALNKSKKIQQQMNRTKQSPSQAASKPSKTDDITHILIVLVIVFMACQPWEPVRRILEAIYGFQGCGHVYFYYEEFPSLSFAINSAANFVIYCLIGSKFRAVLRRKCGCRQNDSTLDDFSSTSPSVVVTKSLRIKGNNSPELSQNLENEYI